MDTALKDNALAFSFEDGPASNLPALVAKARDLTEAAYADIQRTAQLLSRSLSVPVDFQGCPEKCEAIAYQARLWGLDPVAVASKCYLTPVKGGGERLSYESQLVSAVINTLAPLSGRTVTKYYGEGAQRYAVVTATMRDGTPLEPVASPPIGQIKVKNSPLWFTDPDQQLHYYTQRSFARRHFPEILLGVYSRDEMPFVQVQDVTPKADPYADDFAPYGYDSEGVPLEHPPEIDAEVEREPEPPEPSGGHGWKASDAGGPKTVGEGDDQQDVREVVAAAQTRILALSDAEAVRAEWTKLAESKPFGVLVSYHPDIAKAVRASVAARVKALSSEAPTEG